MPRMHEIPVNLQNYIRRRSKKEGKGLDGWIRKMGLVPWHEHKWVKGMGEVCDLLKEKGGGYDGRERRLLYNYGGARMCRER